MRRRQDGILLASALRVAVELDSEVVVRGMGDGPRQLAQDGAQPAIARRGLAAEALASALFVARSAPPKKQDAWLTGDCVIRIPVSQ
jgi:hypothetical protein